MSKPEQGFLYESTSHSFGLMTKEERLSACADRNILLSAQKPTTFDQAMVVAKGLQSQIGLPVCSTRHVLFALEKVCELSGREIPFPNIFDASGESKSADYREAAMKEQGAFFEELGKHIEVELDEDKRYQYNFVNDKGARISITQEVEDAMNGSVAVIPRLEKYAMHVPKITPIIQNITGKCRTIFVGGSSTQYDMNSRPVVVTFDGGDKPNPSVRKRSNRVLDVNENPGVDLQSYAVYKEVIKAAGIHEKSRQIQRGIESGTIHLEPAFDLHANWPRHPLMNDIRQKVMPYLVQYVTKMGLVLDYQDLIHQVLFRMTTLCPSKIYKNGDEVMHHLSDIGALTDWRKINEIDPSKLGEVDPDLIFSFMHEQAKIINARMAECPIDFASVVSSEGFSPTSEGRWNLQWDKANPNKSLVAVHPNRENTKRVIFGRVDPDTAALITGNFHYIHTVRSEGPSYGLFFEGMDLPFAVETVEPTSKSRPYKQAVFLANGFNPHRGIELTRMYTFPGCPTGIIGIMDKLVPNTIKGTFPEIQFMSTTVMPTYAQTRSTTIAGGVDKPIFIKRGGHKFAQMQCNGETVWMHVTNRNLAKAAGDKVIESHPNFPLLPVVDVVRQVGTPTFTPIHSVSGSMIVV